MTGEIILALIRVRQHVNPLSSKYQVPTASPNWEKVYARVDQPLHLDIGCARGRFVLKMAELRPDWNFLGLEIREPLVEDANRVRDELGLTNLHYIFCNANISLQPILTSLPLGRLQRVTIQFPDPWFKKRHQKRRVVQPELVADLAKYLAVRGEILLQSDVKAVAVEMRSQFAASPAFSLSSPDWLSENPLPVPTERELYTLANNEPVYRALFRRNAD